MMRKFLQLLGMFVVAGFVALGCGPTEPEEFSEEDETATSGGGAFGGGSQPGATTRNADDEYVFVPVEVRSSSSGFNLLASSASDYTLEVTGCASGFTNTGVTAANVTADSGVQVYKYDRDCQIRLTDFEYDSVTYTYSSGFTNYTDYATDSETGLYTNGGATRYVRIETQLPAQITGDDGVVFEFSEVEDSSDDETIAEATVAEAQTVAVTGVDPPSFTIEVISMTGTTVGGGGQFQFKLECTSAIAGGSDDTTDTCEGVPLSQISYQLVNDTDGAGDGDDWTGDGVDLAEIETKFDTPIAVINADVAAPAEDGSIADGGFITTTSVDGPDQIHVNHDMVLILRNQDPALSANDSSYVWFEVDVQVITQP